MKNIVVAYVQKKEIKSENEKENLVVRNLCHLTGNFIGLAQDECSIRTRKRYVSFVCLVLIIT